ncbi:unnamed protein product [Dibothriocephalus latus]|uniref:Peptidase M1 membrane alanine aminopeptidase domain-containing protein n=1 Tax=Dibothriocephalus latus TaxID=60516 RepID=A0A3P7R989_DIBLA|nr:unnamed protein product [Dibothriocephalus latus]
MIHVLNPLVTRSTYLLLLRKRDLLEPKLTVFLTSEFYSAMQMDELKTSHPIEVPVKSPSEVEEIFDAVSYEKGASIIRMLRDYIGPEVSFPRTLAVDTTLFISRPPLFAQLNRS